MYRRTPKSKRHTTLLLTAWLFPPGAPQPSPVASLLILECAGMHRHLVFFLLEHSSPEQPILLGLPHARHLFSICSRCVLPPTPLQSAPTCAPTGRHVLGSVDFVFIHGWKAELMCSEQSVSNEGLPAAQFGSFCVLLFRDFKI